MLSVRTGNWRGAVVAASVTAVLLSQRHSGFLLIFEALFLIPWLVYSAYVMVTQPARRKTQCVRVLAWLLSVAVVVGVHLYVAHTTRSHAEEIVQRIKSYVVQHGRCVATLDELGLSREALRATVGLSAYGCDAAGKPSFFYAVTYVPFETYSYDFDGGVWQYSPD